MPTPEVLGRNGTYVVFRKLHTRVAAYRQYLHAKAASREEEALLGAKMVGRWQSGAPLALSPERDDPAARRRPEAQQRLPLRGRSAWVQVPGRRARTPRQPAGRARRRRKRQRSPPPHDPPRHELRADAARRGARGRRRGPRDHLRVRRRAPEAPVRVRQDPVAERRHLHRRPGREGPARRSERRIQQLHDPAAAHPAPPAGTAAVRRHPRRRVLLRAGPAGAALAGGARRRDDEGERRGNDPDRHRSLEGARLRPAAIRRGGARRARARRVRRGRARRRDHPEPAARRQRDHDRDGRAADGDPRDDRGPSLRSRRHHHRRRDARVLGRQRPAPTQGHDQGGLAAPASGLRSHALHAAPAAEADLRRRQRDRLRRRLGDRPEHRLHHRLRERDLRPARGDDRPRGRRRLAGLPPRAAAAGEGTADADDRRSDHRAKRPTAWGWSTRSTRRPS